METVSLLQTHRVFGLDEAVRALDPASIRKVMLDDLQQFHT